MKLYALFTLHKTGWGTRSGIGDPATATTAAQNHEKNPLVGAPEANYDSPAVPNPYETAQHNQYGDRQDAYPMYDTTGYDGQHGESHHGMYDIEMSQNRR
jgi:hypothetical protein